MRRTAALYAAPPRCTAHLHGSHKGFAKGPRARVLGDSMRAGCGEYSSRAWAHRPLKSGCARSAGSIARCWQRAVSTSMPLHCMANRVPAQVRAGVRPSPVLVQKRVGASSVTMQICAGVSPSPVADVAGVSPVHTWMDAHAHTQRRIAVRDDSSGAQAHALRQAACTAPSRFHFLLIRSVLKGIGHDRSWFNAPKTDMRSFGAKTSELTDARASDPSGL